MTQSRQINQRPVAVITGAASGIGAACARSIAGLGYTVVGFDVDDESGRRTFGELGAPHEYRHLDVRDADQWKTALAAVARDFGRLDVLHLNAGVMIRPKGRPLLDNPLDWLSVDSYRKVMSVNLDGVVFGILAALGSPGLRQIIITASGAALAPLAMDPFYTTSKYAVLGLGLSLAPSLKERGVRLDVICPGAIDTALTAPDIRAAVKQEPATFIAESVAKIVTDDQEGSVWLAFSEKQGLQRFVPPGLAGVGGALDVTEAT